MTELNREFKLLDLLDVWNAQTDAPSPKVPELVPIAEAHQRNVRRVYLLAIFPAAIVNVVEAKDRIRSTVTVRHRHDVDSGAMKRDVLYARIDSEILADMQKRAVLLATREPDAQERIKIEAIHGFRTLEGMLNTALAEGGDALTCH